MTGRRFVRGSVYLRSFGSGAQFPGTHKTRSHFGSSHFGFNHSDLKVDWHWRPQAPGRKAARGHKGQDVMSNRRNSQFFLRDFTDRNSHADRGRNVAPGHSRQNMPRQASFSPERTDHGNPNARGRSAALGNYVQCRNTNPMPYNRPVSISEGSLAGSPEARGRSRLRQDSVSIGRRNRSTTRALSPQERHRTRQEMIEAHRDRPSSQITSEAFVRSVTLPMRSHGRECNLGLGVGDPVEILSESAGWRWVTAHVVEFQEEHRVYVQYKIENVWYGKSLGIRSERLRPLMADADELPDDNDDDQEEEEEEEEEKERDPEANFSFPQHMEEALSHVTIRYPLSEKPRPVTHGFKVVHIRNSAFVVCEPLEGPCEVGYTGSSTEDVVLRAFTLPTTRPRDLIEEYDHVGYAHSMQSADRKVVVASGTTQRYYLGLEVHRDLNKDLLWEMKAEDRKNFINKFLRQSGDVQCEASPLCADYLLSFASGNKEKNNPLLEHLKRIGCEGPHNGGRGGPLRFCTDRSLGFANHFDETEGIYLGKHRFGQPTAKGTWFEEYKEAALQTKFGILVLSFTKEYLGSVACRKEVSRIPQERICVYVRDQNRIVTWEALKEDRALCVAALGGYEAEKVAKIASQEAHEAKTALPFYELTLKLAESEFGRNHPKTAQALHNLGIAYGDLGDAKRKKELLERALGIQEPHYGRDHPQVAITLTNLGNAYGALGDAKRAKELLERALGIFEAHYGRDHHEVAITLTNLGNAYGDLGDAKRKKELLERALGIKEAHYGRDHPEVAITLTNLGIAYGALGDAKRQKELLERALGIFERKYPPGHPHVKMVRSWLGRS